MKRLLFVFVVLALAFTQIAAAAPDSTTVAVNITTVLLMLITPFLPLPQLKISGPTMVLVSMAVAFVVAVAAQLITGELKTADLQAGAGPLLLEFGKLWAIQQAVYALLKDHSKVGPLLTTAPILAAPAKPAIP